MNSNELIGRKYFQIGDRIIRFLCCLHDCYQHNYFANGIEFKPQWMIKTYYTDGIIRYTHVLNKSQFVQCAKDNNKRNRKYWGVCDFIESWNEDNLACLLCGELILTIDEMSLVIGLIRLGDFAPAANYLSSLGFYDSNSLNGFIT